MVQKMAFEVQKMTRKEYLEKCRKVSMLPKSLYNNPCSEKIPEDCIFEIKGIKYYPAGYMLSFENGNIKHTAELRELKTHYTHLFELSEVIGKDWK